MSIDPSQGGSVFLTALDRLYEKVTATHADLQVMAGKVDRALETNQDQEQRIRRLEPLPAAVRSAQEDVNELKEYVHEKLTPRMSSLERWRWGVGGAVGVLSIGGSAVVGYFTAKH